MICPDKEAAARVKFLATQARENRPYYYHEVIGYNYRLSNISAGIGCGQMETIDQRIGRRREIHGLYESALSGKCGIEVQNNPSADYNSNFWLTTIRLDRTCRMTPDELRIKLAEQKIETRLLWRPMHMQPVFANAPYYGSNVGEDLFDRGLCLPSGSSLRDDQIERVINEIRKLI